VTRTQGQDWDSESLQSSSKCRPDIVRTEYQTHPEAADLAE